MSYVFSKALKETPEEREKRIKAQQERWKANNAAYMRTHSSTNTAMSPTVKSPVRLPPPIAFKPAPPVTNKPPTPKATTPTRDNEFGTGPKMGGMFLILTYYSSEREGGIRDTSVLCKLYKAL